MKSTLIYKLPDLFAVKWEDDEKPGGFTSRGRESKKRDESMRASETDDFEDHSFQKRPLNSLSQITQETA